MLITDRKRASAYLSRVGYYRLSAYWYPFRTSRRVTNTDGSTTRIVEDQFRPNTDFQTIIHFYVFDKKLRMLMLDALERIEVALRTQIALQLGQYGAFAHRDPSHLDGKFVQNIKCSHADWLQQLDSKAQKSKEQFAEHFRQKYSTSAFPIWIAVELLDFGPLSILLNGLSYRDKQAIASQFAVPRPDLLTSWVRTLCNVRNICAHHARLWNKPIADQPRLPRNGEVPDLDHLLSLPAGPTRLYAPAAICRFLLRTINPSTSWAARLKAHLGSFPPNPYVSLANSGFPNQWENEKLWR